MIRIFTKWNVRPFKIYLIDALSLQGRVNDDRAIYVRFPSLRVPTYFCKHPLNLLSHRRILHTA